MKISAIVLSALISFSAVAQTPKQKDGDKSKTSTIKQKKTEKSKKDSLKTASKKPKVISSGYCPPCGMG